MLLWGNRIVIFQTHQYTCTHSVGVPAPPFDDPSIQRSVFVGLETALVDRHVFASCVASCSVLLVNHLTVLFAADLPECTGWPLRTRDSTLTHLKFKWRAGNSAAFSGPSWTSYVTQTGSGITKSWWCKLVESRAAQWFIGGIYTQSKADCTFKTPNLFGKIGINVLD